MSLSRSLMLSFEGIGNHTSSERRQLSIGLRVTTELIDIDSHLMGCREVHYSDLDGKFSQLEPH